MLDPTARVLRLLSLLQTHRFWPGSELAGELDVSARTLRRDIERLRELGYSVDATPGAAGGYRLAAGNHLPPLVLDDDEAVAISVGLRSAAAAAIVGIEDTALRALAKLETVLPDRVRRRVNALHDTTVSLRHVDTAALVDPATLALLAQGCRDREEVRFDYEARDGEQTRRLVRPHQLVSVGRRWYLVAFDVRRDDWRTFRLDRMTTPSLAGARFAPLEPPTGDAAAFVERSLRSAPMQHRATVLVAAPLERVQPVARWVDADAESVDDETTRIQLRAEVLGWLVVQITTLAVEFDISVDGTPELAAMLQVTGARLAPDPGPSD